MMGAESADGRGKGFTHLDSRGNAVMVDVSEKEITVRTARASGRIRVSRAVMDAVTEGTAAKGDVLGTARIAGIQAAKRTWELIPLCHMLPLDSCRVEFEPDREAGVIRAQAVVKNHGRTGVEMEALTAVSTALLTIYDMCKALDKSMEIGEIHLDEKDGGRSGHFTYPKDPEKLLSGRRKTE